jgi:hypothetical protein
MTAGNNTPVHMSLPDINFRPLGSINSLTCHINFIYRIIIFQETQE